MTPRHLALALALTSACGPPPPGVPGECLADEPVLLVAGQHDSVEVRRAGDTTYLALVDLDLRPTTHAGRGCGAEPVLLADGARLLPTRIAVDPRDDDPIYACDQDTARHYRVDLTGERAPLLMLPDLGCFGHPVAYGALFAGGFGYVRLFADFPDEATATDLRDDPGNHLLALDEWLVYDAYPDLVAYEYATGRTVDLHGNALSVQGHGEHILWFDYEDIATATLVHIPTNHATVLGSFDRDAAWDARFDLPGVSIFGWGFGPDGRHIFQVHPDLPPAAFDLDGHTVPLPAPGQLLALHPDGVVSVDRDDGRLHFTRLGAAAPTPLDALLADDETRRQLSVTDDHLEKVIAGDLVRVPLDGSPARTVAADVGHDNLWLGDQLLLTLHDGTLERIDTSTAEHTRLATHVTRWQLVDGDLYYLTADSPDPDDDGLWFLSAAALDSTPPA